MAGRAVKVPAPSAMTAAALAVETANSVTSDVRLIALPRCVSMILQ